LKIARALSAPTSAAIWRRISSSGLMLTRVTGVDMRSGTGANGYARCHCFHYSPRVLFLIASVSFPHRIPGEKIPFLHGAIHNFLLTQHTLLQSRINPCCPPEGLND